MRSLFFSLVFITVSLTSTLSAQAGILTKSPNNLGLVGYWSFGDGRGAVATDFSGNKRSLNLNNGPAWATGKIGASLDFDGVNDFASVTSTLGITGNATFTLSAWIRPDSVGSAATIAGFIGGGGAGDAAMILAPNGSGSVGLWMNSCGAVTGTGVITTGSWQHIVITKTAGSSATTVTLYVNGVSQSLSTQFSSCTPSIASTRFNVGSGWNASNSDQLFDGRIDEVRVYNRALSSTEVTALYGQTRIMKLDKPGPLADANLVFYLKMNESSGDAVDASGNGLTFTNNSSVGRANGKIFGAGSFSGGNYFSRADSAALSPTTAATWSFWFYKTSAYSGSSNMLTSKWSFNSTNGWGHRTNGTEFEASLENYNYAGITSGLNLAANTWYHAVVVFNGAGVGNSGRLKVYINGSEKTLTYTGTIPSTISDTTNAFEIGGWSNIGYYFAGIIDEFGFWSRALTAAEVATLYNGGAGLSHPFTTSTAKIAQSRNTIAPTNLVVWHSFDGPYLNTTTSTDRGSSGNHGTLANGPTPKAGKVGQALRFDGSDDRIVTMQNPSGLGYGAGDFSWFAWIYPERVNDSYEMIWAQGGSGIPYFAVRDDVLHVYVGSTYETTSGYIAANTWQHVGVVRSSGTLTLYKNGVAYSSTSSQPGSISAPDYAYISSYGSGGAHAFKGVIDDLRIYNKALSTTEILALYNQGK